MINLAAGTKVFLACRPIDLGAGFNGLAAKAQQVIGGDPFSGHLFLFRGKRGDYFKAIYWDGTGLWLLAKRLEKGRFVWPPIVDGAMTLTPAQLAVLIEAMDWRLANYGRDCSVTGRGDSADVTAALRLEPRRDLPRIISAADLGSYSPRCEISGAVPGLVGVGGSTGR